MGIATIVAKDAESRNKVQPLAKSDAAEMGSIVATSAPAAEVYLDGAFVGNSTETLKLPAGKRSIKVTLAGYKDWTKDLAALANSEPKLNASLEKQN